MSVVGKRWLTVGIGLAVVFGVLFLIPITVTTYFGTTSCGSPAAVLVRTELQPHTPGIGACTRSAFPMLVVALVALEAAVAVGFAVFDPTRPQFQCTPRFTPSPRSVP